MSGWKELTDSSRPNLTGFFDRMERTPQFKNSSEELKRAANRFTFKIVTVAVSVVLLVAFFLAIAGRFDWMQGWAYVAIVTLGQTISSALIWRRNPELLIRRGMLGAGTKGWDKMLLALFGLTYLAELIVAALDERFQWSSLGWWLWPVGCALYIFFVVVLTWAMAVNPFFETTVRIQSDRGHQVVESGPYRFVRHPGYLAIILGLILAAPLLLGSWWAFIPALLSTSCLVIRTALEDRLLQQELSGYAAYARRVPYRLLPGVW